MCINDGVCFLTQHKQRNTKDCTRATKLKTPDTDGWQRHIENLCKMSLGIYKIARRDTDSEESGND